jgi:hypothetical protein
MPDPFSGSVESAVFPSRPQNTAASRTVFVKPGRRPPRSGAKRALRRPPGLPRSSQTGRLTANTVSFSSEKEESCSFLKKRTKRLLLPGAGSKIRDLAGKYMVFQEIGGWRG